MTAATESLWAVVFFSDTVGVGDELRGIYDSESAAIQARDEDASWGYETVGEIPVASPHFKRAKDWMAEKEACDELGVCEQVDRTPAYVGIKRQ